MTLPASPGKPDWTLIIPCATPASAAPTGRPKWLLTTPDGQLLAARAAASVPQDRIARRIVVFLRETEERYGCTQAFRRAFGDGIECCILDERTEGPAHTVREAITNLGLAGPVCIKDSDSFFDIGTLPDGSFLAVTDVRGQSSLSFPGRKSYVRVNEQGFVCEIAEQSVISNLISVGLYGFRDPATFVAGFDELAGALGHRGIYVSHVIEKTLAEGAVFEPCQVTGLVDIGSLADWNAYRAGFATLVLDIDGVIFRNQSRYFPPYWGTPAEPIEANISHLRALQVLGAQFVFMTARPETLRAETETALAATGLRVHALVMGCNHGTRYLVNDYGTSNAYPSAIAVNLQRNAANLDQLLLTDLPERERGL